jgi:hypothetical protein
MTTGAQASSLAVWREDDEVQGTLALQSHCRFGALRWGILRDLSGEYFTTESQRTHQDTEKEQSRRHYLLIAN